MSFFANLERPRHTTDTNNTSSTVVGTAAAASEAPQRKPATTTVPCCCLVCYNELRPPKKITRTGTEQQQLSLYYLHCAVGIAPCHHNEICAACHLRLRHLHGDFHCPVCKTRNDRIIVDYYHYSYNNNEQQPKTYEDYPMWGDDLGADFVFVHDNMFFPVDYYRHCIQPLLLNYHCTVKDCGFVATEHTTTTKPAIEGGAQKRGANQKSSTNATSITTTTTASSSSALSTSNLLLNALQDHLRKAHRLTLCLLCVEHKRDFVARLPRYSPGGLEKHTADPRSGHAVCEFCRPQLFYDVTALYNHLNQEHYKCHVCTSSSSSATNPVHNQYFRHYTSLQRHFDQAHFLCHNVQCLQARFVVFANELDFRAHERSVHGGNTSTTKLALEFRIASSFSQPSSSSSRNANSHNRGASAAAPRASDFDYELDGTPFVPAAAVPPPPNANNNTNVGMQSLHAARTQELVLRATQLRIEQNNNNTYTLSSTPSQQEDAAFPTLYQANDPTGGGSNEPNNNRLTIGWTSDGTLQRLGRQKAAGAVTDEDFPSLATAPKKKKASFTAVTAARPLSSNVRGMSSSNSKAKAPLTASSGWTTVAPASHTSTAYPQPSHAPLLNNSIYNTNVSNLTPLVKLPATRTANLDLFSSNFPPLGPSFSRPYTSADAYSKRQATTSTASHVAADNFPVLRKSSSAGTSVTQNHKNSSDNNLPALTADHFPSLTDGATATKLNNNHNFASRTTPAYAEAVALAQKQAREKALSVSNAGTSASNGLLSVATVSVSDMKAALGPTAFKMLKKFTREFADRAMSADAYVDHAASLFSHGYSDANFWTFVPALVASCPSSADKDSAMRYMEHLRRMRNGAVNAEAIQAAAAASTVPPSHEAPPVSGWSTATAVSSSASIPPRVTGSAPNMGRTIPPPPPSQAAFLNHRDQGFASLGPPRLPPKPSSSQHQKSAWGSSATPQSVVRPKPSALSVTGLAPPPQPGTATAYMAQEAKKSNAGGGSKLNGTGSTGGSSKKKNKQKNELRSLAFGS